MIPRRRHCASAFAEGTAKIIPLIDAASTGPTGSVDLPIEAPSTRHVVFDMDVVPQDNSSNKKQAITYTLK